jgi:two-component system, response regulator PdtaR
MPGVRVTQADRASDLVLVVEDETLIRMDAADIIRDLGFRVVEAVDAEHAVFVLESVPDVSVVFTDIQMPGSMDGLLLAAVVRDRWPPVALLVTSGKISPPAADLPSGARFISEPYSSLELKDQLHSLTGHR